MGCAYGGGSGAGGQSDDSLTGPRGPMSLPGAVEREGEGKLWSSDFCSEAV